MTNEEAIKQLKGMAVGAEWLSPHMVEALDIAIEALQRTSNAHPTHECVKPTHERVEPVGNSDTLRHKGKWIEDAGTFYKAVNEYGGGVDENTPYFTDDIACSKCLAKFSVIDNETERFYFCPHCGADMRGEEQ